MLDRVVAVEGVAVVLRKEAQVILAEIRRELDRRGEASIERDSGLFLDTAEHETPRCLIEHDQVAAIERAFGQDHQAVVRRVNFGARRRAGRRSEARG